MTSSLVFLNISYNDQKISDDNTDIHIIIHIAIYVAKIKLHLSNLVPHFTCTYSIIIKINHMLPIHY